MATAAPAVADDPNDVLSEYRVFRHDAEEQAIYVRRLDETNDQRWLEPNQILQIGYTQVIGFDRTSRFLWLTRHRWWTRGSTLIDLRNGTHMHVSPVFWPGTLAANSTGDRIVGIGADNGGIRLGLFDWSSQWGVGTTSWFRDVVNSRFVGGTPVAAYPVRDDLVIITGTSAHESSKAFPMVVADTRSGAIVAEFEPDSLNSPCNVIDLRNDEIFCWQGRNIVRIDAGSGAHRGTYPRPGRNDARDNWILPAGDAFLAISTSGAGTEVQVFNPADGTVLDEASLGIWIDDVSVPPPGDIAILNATDPVGRPRGIVPLFLDSLEPATLIAHDPNGIDTFAIGWTGPEWTPPALATLTPTATPTPTATRKPTRTPCGSSGVTISMHPETARPGETVELRVEVGSASGCLEGFAASFAARGGIRLETGGHISHPCRSPGNEDPDFFSSFATDCDAAGRSCTAGTSLLRAGYSDTYVRVPMPTSFSIRCRATVPLDAAPADGSIAVTLVEFDRHLGRRPAVERSVPLRVAGAAFTPTPTATATPTRTATPAPTRPPAPTPCADCPAILLQRVHAARGGIAVIDVRLRSAGHEIVALQTDLTLPAGITGRGSTAWRCRGNPFLRQRAAFHRFDCADDACRSVRALLYGLEPGIPPLPDGMTLFTCRVAVAPAAARGIGELVASRSLASDAQGRQVPLSAEVALVTIR